MTAKPDKKPNEPFSCTIEKLIFGGWGLTHHAGKTIFIGNAATGEEVQARIYKKAKGVRYAEIEQIIKPNAAARVDKKCRHAGICGGCSYQHLNADYQLQTKEAILRESFFHQVELGQTIISPQQFNYRNKMEFGFTRGADQKITFGLHPRGRFRYILDLQECHLINPDLWAIGQQIKQLLLEHYPDDTVGEKGFWQHLTMRQAFGDGSVLITIEAEDPYAKQVKHLASLIQNIPGVIGVCGKKRHGQPFAICGNNYLDETIGDCQFRYYAENFFQVNVSILPILLNEINNLVTEIKPKILYDLFSGVGLFGIALGKKLGKDVQIIAAEADATAAQIGNDNAKRNGLENYHSQALDLYQKGWGSALRRPDAPSVLIVDPPRAGLMEKTISEIGQLNPDRIIYVSCNPTTQKRDIDWLGKWGYKLSGLRLIDMFPQTYHLESLAWLDRQ